MFIFGYVNEQSEVNIYAENFWGFSPITMFLPAMMGGMFAGSIYKEIKNKSNEQIHYEQPQQSYIPPQTINELAHKEIKIETQPTDQQTAEKAHSDAILKVHPDAYEIGKSQSFYNWINNQPSDAIAYYNTVMKTGSAKQVIDMLSEYKSSIKARSIITPSPTRKEPTYNPTSKKEIQSYPTVDQSTNLSVQNAEIYDPLSHKSSNEVVTIRGPLQLS